MKTLTALLVGAALVTAACSTKVIDSDLHCGTGSRDGLESHGECCDTGD